VVPGTPGTGRQPVRGQGRNTVPTRSAISGTVLAVVMVVATLTFGSSLSTLVSHPPLYGWKWSYALSAVQGIGASGCGASPRSFGPMVLPSLLGRVP